LLKKINYLFSSKTLFLFVLLTFLLTKFYFANYSSVNYEFLFPLLSKAIFTNDHIFISFYDRLQANNYGFSFLISPITFLYDYPNSLYALRYLNIALVIIFFISFRKYLNFINLSKYQNQLFLLILLNPLFFTFSSRASVDFIPFVLAFICIVNILNKNYLKISYTLLAIIAYIKIIYLSYFFIIFIINFQQYFSVKSLIFKKLHISRKISFLIRSTFAYIKLDYHYYFLSMIIFICLCIFNKLIFGFTIVPPTPDGTHEIVRPEFDFGFRSVPNNTINYIALSSLLIYPLVILPVITSIKYNLKNIITLFLIIFISFLLSRSYLSDTGELNLSFFDSIINSKNRFFLLAVYFFMTSFFTLNSIKKYAFIEKGSHIIYSLAILSFFCLFVFSFLRPVQRYILPFLPFLLVFYFLITKSKAWVIHLTTIIFFILSIFITLNTKSNQDMHDEIDEFLTKNYLFEETNGSSIYHLLGYKFYNYENFNKKYIIKARSCNASLKNFKSGFFVFKKTYCIDVLN